MSDPRSARMEQDCQHLAVENSRLAARLAEVEAERDEAWKFAQERIEKQNVETGKRVDLIHEREAFRAERDRLAQELEDAQTERDGLLMQNDLGGERLREMASERDRLVQELEDAKAKARTLDGIADRFYRDRDRALWFVGALRESLRDSEAAGPMVDLTAVDEFLARFPREGDEG